MIPNLYVCKLFYFVYFCYCFRLIVAQQTICSVWWLSRHEFFCQFDVLWCMIVCRIRNFDLSARTCRRLQTMTMGEHLILPGGTMTILMSIFGKLLEYWLWSFPSIITNHVFFRSLHCFELGWPWKKGSSFFLKPKPRSKVSSQNHVIYVVNWCFILLFFMILHYLSYFMYWQ